MTTPIDTSKYLNLVRHIALDFLRRRGCHDPVDDSDEFSQGCIGLVQAARRFDPSHGCKFVTYAHRYIWGFIMRGTWRRAGYRPAVQFSQINDPDDDQKQVPVFTGVDLDSREWITWALSFIHGRTRAMVADRYIAGRTFQQIADDWDMTNQNVQIIVKNGVRRIRMHLHNKGITRGDFSDEFGRMDGLRKLA